LIGSRLETLASKNPGIKRILPLLNELRMASPQPYDSLVDMAKAAGLLSPALLVEIARLDPLNSQPSFESLAPPPEPQTPELSVDSPSELIETEPTQGVDTLLFSSREEVVAFLAKSGEKTLANASMPGLDLSELDFSHLDLSGADLRDTKLAQTVFNNAILTGATLTGAVLDQTVIAGADLTAASLISVTASHTDFSQTILSKADFSMADLSSSHLKGFTADWAIFSGTILPKDLSSSKLHRANFNNIAVEGLADL
jgi:hypothetical protein